MGCGSSSEASSPQTNNPPKSRSEQNDDQQRTANANDVSSAPPAKTNATSNGETSAPPAKTNVTSNGETSKTNDNAVSNQFVQEGVKSHNNYRSMHDAPAMKVAQDLVDYAQNYANKLAEIDQMKHSNCTLPSGERVGENLYCYWSSDKTALPTADDAVKSWYDEIKDYNFNSPGFAMNTGHFTQVVWKGSVELGMAWAKASSGTTYVVANYRPAGNMMGAFEGNVLPKK